MDYRVAGDRALVVRFGTEINEATNKKVRAMRQLLEQEKMEGIEEVIPTYCTLYVFYDPFKTDPKSLIDKLSEIEGNADESKLPPARVVQVPVAYGGECGPDLENVANIHGLKPEEVIERHANKKYLVYMLGFTPGFTFCGGLSDDLATPRHKDPRLKVPAGSVGIAGKQTGLYAISSPGGWQLVGRTYMRFYDPSKNPPTPVRAGDYVEFLPVSAEEFEKNRHLIEAVDAPSPDALWQPGGVAAFEVVNPGMLTTIQDRGRFGYQELGISCSGAMDEISFRLANRLVGNDDNAPAIEITGMGPTLKVLATALIAVTGADLSFAVNGKAVNPFESILVNPGDTLSFGQIKRGMRAYLAVNGGIAVPFVLGSATTDLKAMLGGFKGRKLEKSDVLNKHVKPIPEPFIGFSVDPRPFAFGGEENVFRVILGPEEDHFTNKGIETFLGSEYEVSSNSDRMGSRLSGPKIEHGEKGPNIVSDGITFGSIQVPAEGYPLVLLKDRQAIGGYTKIGTLCSVDAYRFGQVKPGDKVSFRAINLDQAQELLWKMEYEVSRVGLKQQYLAKTGAKEGNVYRFTDGDSVCDIFVEKMD